MTSKLSIVLTITLFSFHAPFLVAKEANQSGGMITASVEGYQSGADAFSLDIPSESGDPQLSAIKDPLWGQGVKALYPLKNGDFLQLIRYDRNPFLFVSIRFENRGNQDRLLKSYSFPTLHSGQLGYRMKSFGSKGLANQQDSYTFLAAVVPDSGEGVLCGWLTQQTGSGVIFSSRTGSVFNFFPRIDFGSVVLEAGEVRESDTVLIGSFSSLFSGLELYGEMLSLANQVQLKDAPFMMDTEWFLDEEVSASTVNNAVGDAIVHFSDDQLSVFKIDSGWQGGLYRLGSPGKNFYKSLNKGGFPRGMKSAADLIELRGLIPGLWLMPFSVEYPQPGVNPDYLLKTEKGILYNSLWSGYTWDLTHPGALKKLENLFQQANGEWGFQFFELNGLWSGLGVDLCYISRDYKEDGIGRVQFYNKKKSAVEAYRQGLNVINSTIDENCYLLGGSSSQNMRIIGPSMGLVDAMKLGLENSGKWIDIMESASNASKFYFLNRKVWRNDADIFSIQSSRSLSEARLLGSWTAYAGNLLSVSSKPSGFSEYRKDLVDSITPDHGLNARPVDLFTSKIAGIWALEASGKDSENSQNLWNLVGFFNWNSSREKLVLPVQDIDLSLTDKYIAFEYWNREYVTFKKELKVPLGRHSCKLFSIKKRVGYPILIGTSSHVAQGAVDIIEENWDGTTYRGISFVEKNRPLTLYFYAEDKKEKAMKIRAISIDVESRVKKVLIEQHLSYGKQCSVTIKSPVAREVNWAVEFGK